MRGTHDPHELGRTVFDRRWLWRKTSGSNFQQRLFIRLHVHICSVRL